MAGRDWATRVADVPELRRLEITRDSIGNWRSRKDGADFSAAERVFYVIEPESTGNRAAAVEFWEHCGAPGPACPTTPMSQPLLRARSNVLREHSSSPIAIPSRCASHIKEKTFPSLVRRLGT